MLTLAKDIRDSDGDLSSNTCGVEVLDLTIGSREKGARGGFWDGFGSHFFV